jgi:hypothetical protein
MSDAKRRRHELSPFTDSRATNKHLSRAEATSDPSANTDSEMKKSLDAAVEQLPQRSETGALHG